jgi:UDP-glucose:(heptosyl)LPS alpha-1,3-glucosyltransferase
MKMKVAIITERADIALGGAERSVFELADALSERGLEVDILAATGQTTDKNTHILFKNSSAKRTCYFKFAKALKKHLAENHYDIVHSVLPFDFADVYQPRGGTYAESILRNIASYQNKFIESYKRVTAYVNLRRTILLQAEKKLCLAAEGPVIAAISEYVAEQFRRHYNTNPKRLLVIPNGVKIPSRYDTAEIGKLRAQVLAQLGVTEKNEPVLFLFAANNFRLKGLAPLIKAMHLTGANCKTNSSYLVAAGRDKPDKYLNLAGNLNIHKRIIFLGKVAHIQNLLSAVDVAVLPTFYDPAGRFTLEAIAVGKPVITTKFNGATDLFVDNRHGRIIDTPENITALAEAICHFTEKDNIRKAAEAITADNLCEKVSVSRVAQQLIPVYASILEKRRQQ